MAYEIETTLVITDEDGDMLRVEVYDSEEDPDTEFRVSGVSGTPVFLTGKDATALWKFLEDYAKDRRPSADE